MADETPLIGKDSVEVPPARHGDGAGGALPPQLFEDRYLIVLALRLEGYTIDEITAKTGLSKDQVLYATRKARQAGKLRDVIDLIDNRAVPQAVENLMAALEDPKNPNWWEATRRTLDGRGAFRKFNDRNTGASVQGIPPLQINILAPGGEMPTVIVNSEKGAVIGEARQDPEDA